MESSTLRYQLPRKAIKADCPDCGPKHHRTLSRYIDTKTGDPLPEYYGRCDRESNCGYHLSPYHKSQSGMSYADEVYQHWKKENARAAPRQERRYHAGTNSQVSEYLNSVQRTSTIPSFVQPVYSIPDDLFQRSLGHYEHNQFARLLMQHFGVGTAGDLLSLFRVGTSSRWPGACVFWYIDEQGRKRGGQIKLFDQTFHTVKYTNGKGRKCSKTSWVHSSYAYRCDQRQERYPDWLTAYIEQHEFSPCLFGLPQLLTAPTDKPVAVVESPKTAVLCTLYFPQFIWVAVGALSYFNAERLAPLLGRSIIAFPDGSIKGKNSSTGKDFNTWYRKASQLREQGLQIEVSDFLEQRVTEEEREKGIDLADCLLKDWEGYPPDWDKPTLPGTLPTIRETAVTKILVA